MEVNRYSVLKHSKIWTKSGWITLLKGVQVI